MSSSATGVGDKAAGYMLTGTLAAFAVGRFSSAWLMKHFHARTMLGVYAVVNVVLGLVAVLTPKWLGAMCLLTTSLFMSIMFPTIFALGLKGMGEKTKTAGSLLVMAILGGAALTKVMGMLAEQRMQAAILVPVACFAGVALYAWFGGEHKGASGVSCRRSRVSGVSEKVPSGPFLLAELVVWGVGTYSATTGLVSEPRPSTVTVTVSPGLSQRFGVRPRPTPEGCRWRRCRRAAGA